MLLIKRTFSLARKSCSQFTRAISSQYKQGQSFKNERGKSIREYFYYIDHHGQLFLDDSKIKNFTSCFKEQHFLEFYFRNLRINKSDRFQDKNFKYVSNCGIEKNYLKCNDLPFVATYLDTANDIIQLNNIRSPYWSVRFIPENLLFDTNNGRLYYLFENEGFNPLEKAAACDANTQLVLKRRGQHFNKLPCKICLVKSSISIRLMENLQEIQTDEQIAYEFEYKGKVYRLKLTNEDQFIDTISKFSCYDGSEPEN